MSHAGDKRAYYQRIPRVTVIPVTHRTPLYVLYNTIQQDINIIIFFTKDQFVLFSPSIFYFLLLSIYFINVI